MSQYTSESEFSLDKRVHMTNEIPPYDMYDALNSVVQTDLWKWVLGSTIVDFNLPYTVPKIKEDGNITYTRDIDSKEVYYKMVNGKISQTYGPLPSENKNYHLLEEYGVLLPEFDFLLHEVYRYIDNLYPDHPDYTELLTNNEFNDFITAAGAIIDYAPDNKFFEALSTSLGLNSYEANREAAMIKIRNLRNESFRRKLYGSKAGYRMLANDIFQNATVFPVATYLPLHRVSKSQLDYEKDIYSNANKLNEWNRENGKKFNREQFIEYNRKYNRNIDTYSKFYHKKFRLIDLDGSNSSYVEPKNTDINLFGFPLPFYESSIIEYPAGYDTDSKVPMIKNNTFYISDFDDITRYVESINPDKNVIIIEYSKDKGIEEKEITDKEVHSISLTYPTPVPYNTAYVYPRFDRAVSELLNDAQKEDVLKNYPYLYNREPSTKTVEQNIFSYFYKGESFNNSELNRIIGKVGLINSPFIENTLLLDPESSIKLYPENVKGFFNGVLGKTYIDTESLEIMWDNSTFKKGDYISNSFIDSSFYDLDSVLQITNFTKGSIEVDSYSNSLTSKVPFSDSLYDDDRYGILIKNENGNDIFLQGNVKIEETINGSGLYEIKKVKFGITAIPEEKNEQILYLLYFDEYMTIQEVQIDMRKEIDKAVENNYSEELAVAYLYGDEETSRKAWIEIQKSGLDYDNFLGYVKKYYDAGHRLEVLKKNKEYLYETCEVKDKYGNKSIINRGLISIGYKVENFLLGNGLESAVAKPDVLAYNIAPSLGGGIISYISLGNLNVNPIYQKNTTDGTPDVGADLVVSSCMLKEGVKLNYLELDKLIIEHDELELVNKDGDTVKYPNYNEQALSRIDKTLLEYFSDNYSLGRTNSTIRLVERQDIKIESVIDLSLEGNENTIYFESENSRELFKSLSVGDLVRGPSIDSDDNDVFITKIGDNYVIVNQELQQSGTFILTYSVKTNTAIDNISEDVNMYKKTLYENGLYSISNPFEHGLWPSRDFPNVSNAILDSLPDISFYNFYTYNPPVKGLDFKSNQVILYENCYYDEIQKYENSKDYKYLLSDIKFNNELFLELNLNKLLNYSTKSGKSPILMSVDWLDYLENNLNISSRATDKVNVGVNLMLETDTTGYYTSISNQSYTDPSIRLKFATLNLGKNKMWNETNIDDPDWTVPVYAQIGSGRIGKADWFKSPDDVTYPDIWGYDVYDDIKDASELDEDSDFAKEGGVLKRQSIYGMGRESKSLTINLDTYTSIDEPLFEIPLGEYDTIIKYTQGNNTSNAMTITQASFYAQTFKNLLKFFDEDEGIIKINGKDATQSNILSNFNYSSIVDIDKDVIPDNTFNYAGEWVPSKVKTIKINNGEEEPYYKVAYPKDPEENTYYVIPRDIELDNIGDSNNISTKKYKSSDIAFYKNGKWYIKSFQFISLIGNKYNNGDEEITPKTNLVPTINETNPEQGFSIFERLIQYYLRTVIGAGDAVTEINGLHYTWTENPKEVDTTTLKGRIDNLKSPNFPNLCKDIYNKSTESYEGSLMFFLYIGDKKERSDYQDYMDNRKLDINTGDRVVLARFEYDNNDVNQKDKDEWFMFKINTNSLLGASIPVNIYGFTTKNEYDVITGLNRDSKEDGIDFESTIDKISSSLKLPRGYINDGSFKFNFTVDPKFITKGYKYTKDGKSINTKEEVSFDITKGSIYYDDSNDNFYTFSNIYNEEANNFSNDIKKLAIKFNEPKFFKNVLNTSCAYQVKNVLEEGKDVYTKNPTLYPIKGINFDVNHIDTGDRILEIREINLRSLYSKNLEPTLFSNYTTLSYVLRGINDEGNIILSYTPNLSSVSEKVQVATSLEKYRPIEYKYNEETGDYDITEIQFDNDILDYNTNVTYSAPSLFKPKVTKSFINDGSYGKSDRRRDFTFFKNNLIIKGQINANSPKQVVAPSSDANLFKSALDLISIGDRIEDGYTIDGAFNEQKLRVLLKYKGTVLSSDIKIYRVNYAHNQLVIVTSNGDIYFNSDIELSSIGGTVDVQKLSILGSPSDKIREISFNSKNNKWIMEVDTSGSSNLYEIPSLIEGSYNLSELLPLYNNDKKVYIDDGSTHTLFGSSVDSLVDDETLGDTTYKVNNINEDYINLNNSVIENIGYKFENENGVPTKKEEKAFYKDFAIAQGKLEAKTKNSLKVYRIKEDGSLDFKSEPYLVDNISILDSKYDGRISISDTSLSRTVLVSDNSGKFSAFAKGRDLFIKSPTELVEYDDTEKVYKYTGDLSIESHWKHSKAPIFNDKNYLDITRSFLEDSASAQDLFIESGKVAYDMISSINFSSQAPSLAAQYIEVNGETITSKYEAELAKMKQILQEYVGVDSLGDADGSKIMTLDKLKEALKNKEANDTQVIGNIYISYDKKTHDFILSLKKLKFVEETIRNELTTTIGTEKKKFIALDDNEKIDIVIPDNGRINIAGAYATYVYYLDTFLFGNNANNELTLSSNINKLQFTNDGLFILDELGTSYKINISNLSKVSDIENPDNWISSSYSHEYCIMGRNNNLPSKSYLKVNNTTFTLTQTDSLTAIPIFKPVTSYINDDITILGGYIMSKNEIDRVFKNAIANPEGGVTEMSGSQEEALRLLKEKSLYDNSTCPAIMYSLNGGVSYNTMTLPNILGDTVVDNNNIYINSIKFLENEFRFYCAASSGIDVFGNQIYFIPKTTDGSYNFGTAYLKTVTSDELSEDMSYQIDIDATTGEDDETSIKMSDIQSVATQESGVPEPTGLYRFFITENSNYFDIASSKSINLNDLIITGKGIDSFFVSNNVIPKGDGVVNLLLSLSTSKDVPNPMDYVNISKIDELVNSKGDLRIEEIKEVNDISIANRLYSYRELIKSTTDEDTLGYPSISEDKDRLFYEYDVTKNEAGEDVYTPRALKNKSGNNVLLCTSDGKRVLYNDGSTLNTANFSRRTSYPEEIFVKAAELKYDSLDDIEDSSELRKQDDTLTSLLNTSKICFSNISFNSNDPYIKLDTSLLDNASIADLFFIDDGESTLFISYLVSSTGELKSDNVYEDIRGIKYYDENGESKQRYESKSLTPNITKYWYDNKEKLFIVKNKRFIDSDVYISYSHKGGNASYSNPNLFDVDKKESFNLPITGIYLSNYGYGGERNNNDLWKNVLPWELDKKAFRNDYMKNVNGDYIYLVDESGAEIISNNAEYPNSVNNIIKVERETFSNNKEKEVSTFNLNGQGYVQKFYIRDTPRVDMYFPYENIKLKPKKSSSFKCTLFLLKNSKKIGNLDNLELKFYYASGDNISYSNNATSNYLTYTDNVLEFKTGTEDFNATKVGLDNISGISLKYSYQGISYENKIPVSFSGNIQSPSLSITDILRFIRNKESKNFRYYDFDFDKLDKAPSSIEIKIIDSDASSISFLNTSNFNNTLNPIQFKTSTSDSVSFTGNISNKDIESLNTESLSVSLNNEIFNIILPVIDIGDINTYYYNSIINNTTKLLKGQFFVGDEIQELDNLSFKAIEDSLDNENVIMQTIFKEIVLDEVEIPRDMNDESIINIPYFLNTNEGCVIYYNKDSINLDILKLQSNLSDDVIIHGLKGKIICRKTRYNNFYELLSNEGTVIDGKTLAISKSNRESLVDISLVNKDNSSVILSETLKNIPSLNDEEVHFIKLKILTQKTILTNINMVNDKEYYEELSFKDIDKFSPDRVWYNPEGYPEPPIILGNVIFNEQNNIDYYNESYKNDNGYNIYRCNEEGVLIGYNLVDSSTFGNIDSSSVNYYLTDKDGNITYGAREFKLDKTMTLDMAQITRKPIHKSCKDWFKTEFYLKNHESNPFWQVIKISSDFDNTTKKWQHYAKVCEYKRATSSMVLKEIKNKDDLYLNVSKSLFYRITDTSIQKYSEDNLLDTTNGIIRFLLNAPSEKYKNTSILVKYGITAKNSFYLDSSNKSANKSVWIGNNLNLPVYVDSTYTVNSTENLANPKDRDSDVKSVTELGLFNKFHQLIAYAIFPPIEYRTSSQHLSFTCYIKQGTLTDIR